jgi:hypothetical protein
MGQVPRCRDETEIIKKYAVLSIHCYNREIRIMETPEDNHPRISLLSHNFNEPHGKGYIDIDRDTKFVELWNLLDKFIVDCAQNDGGKKD